MEITNALLEPRRVGDRPMAPQMDRARYAAREFETVFLTEMLKHAGVGKMPEGFNGGPGEAAFTDLLTREYAGEIARSGSLGLADSVMKALQERLK